MARLIRLAEAGDVDEIAAIYAPFATSTPVSFEAEAPDAAEMRSRLDKILENYPWLVCEDDGRVAGYAYASRHRERHHYRWSVDVTVYVHEDFRRQRIGAALYAALLGVLPLQGYVAAYAGIALPNPGSVGLHEAMGFVPVGVYHKVGFKLGRWHDVGWGQRTLIDSDAAPSEPLPLKLVLGMAEWQAKLRYSPGNADGTHASPGANWS